MREEIIGHRLRIGNYSDYNNGNKVCKEWFFKNVDDPQFAFEKIREQYKKLVDTEKDEGYEFVQFDSLEEREKKNVAEILDYDKSKTPDFFIVLHSWNTSCGQYDDCEGYTEFIVVVKEELKGIVTDDEDFDIKKVTL